MRESAITYIQNNAYPLRGMPEDYDLLMERIGNAQFVLLGEASHGTHEFYHTRAEISKRLIVEKGFGAVLIEADWPDAYRANRYVRGRSSDTSAPEALGDFKRFPSWMWRNTDVVNFVEWLYSYNKGMEQESHKIGIYGLDLYSLYGSIEAVLQYLDRVDPEAAQRARYRYACFEHFGEDPQTYGYAASFGLSSKCEEEVVAQLKDLSARSYAYTRRDGILAGDEFFYAEQNARVAKNAEKYYRSMFGGRVSSWNLRDSHMVETLAALVSHFEKQERSPKVVVWEHNSHLGDARATELSTEGELNVGQLIRERYGSQAVLVGFTTYEGSVTAASEWGGIAEKKRVRSALEGSYEALFHDTGIPSFLLLLNDHKKAIADLALPRLERAIGVVYSPSTERISHYFHARLPYQFDAVLHFDHSTAIVPMERTSVWERGEVPETYPVGV